jgi:hypothetical protein
MLPRGLSGKSVGDCIDDVTPGQVVAIDNGGRLDATVRGDILTTVAHRNGIAATAIDGVCRDVRSLELGYPIASRSGSHPARRHPDYRARRSRDPDQPPPASLLRQRSNACSPAAPTNFSPSTLPTD